MSPQAELSPLLNLIGRELIAATPETWNVAILKLEWEQKTPGIRGLGHSIESPEGHRDLVAPTSELVEATTRLVETCELHGQPFKTLLVQVSQNEEGAWRFHAEWNY